MVARFLVTTSIEETWPDANEPILFLGEWCRLYSRKDKWGRVDGKVVPYHWDDRQKLKRDYLYLKELQEKILILLMVKLNQLNNVSYSARYWRILLGPWIDCFCSIMFDRWTMLKIALTDYQISGIRVLEQGSFLSPSNDMLDFQKSYITDRWNELVYGQILEWMNISTEKIGIQSRHPIPHQNESFKIIKRPLNSRELFWRICRSLGKKNKYFFKATYLKYEEEVKLNYKLRQLPFFFDDVVLPTIGPSLKMREDLATFFASNITDDQEDYFYNFICDSLPRHLPTLYLEGYHKLVDACKQQSWPHSPNVIFTSNSHDSDELFKIYAAQHVEAGGKLIVGQHGGNYGTSLWNSSEDHEIAISDAYFTWGWSSKENNNVSPAFNFKTFARNFNRSPKRNGDILLVTMTLPRYSYLMYSAPFAGQWLNYFDEQISFIQSLPFNIQSRILVRLFRQDFGWDQVKRWREKLPNIRLDYGDSPLNILEENCSIYVATYNATTFLETLSLDIPTLIFWNPAYWELREDASIFFDELKRVGIFHDSPESAAKYLSKISGRIDDWWNESDLQNVRQSFCRQYSAMPKRALDIFVFKIKEVENNLEKA